jgi:DNA repair protein SbcD/Mre11
MRLLHTSDWHIGRTFHESSTLDALRGVLAALAEAVEREGIDAVLVAGDVFDSATPAAAAFELFEEAVLAIRRAGAVVVMTSGNHDSPARLGHQAPFAAAGGVHVRTHADAVATPVELRDQHGVVDVFGLPYLEPIIVGGGRTHAEVLSRAMDEVRAATAERGNRSVVLAHCFASAGVLLQAAGGERDITAGGLDVVPLEVFDGPDYVALGHLHSRITLSPRVRYSGAPLHYSFGETSPVRGGWIVELDADGVEDVRWLDLPVPRALSTITGRLADLLTDPRHDGVVDDWVQAVLTDPLRQQDAMARLRQRFPHIARLEHRPEGERPADARSYGERTAGLPDADLIAGFLEHVRQGAGPSDSESALVADVLAAVRAAERAA